jgi:hypothetical protein
MGRDSRRNGAISASSLSTAVLSPASNAFEFGVELSVTLVDARDFLPLSR